MININKISNYIILLIILFIQSTESLSTQLIDYIIVEKRLRKINLYESGKKITSFDISLGFDPIGHKSRQGDGKTPEGLYMIEEKISNSSFYLALKISYPNKWDARSSISIGENPGGQIMIHGLPNGRNEAEIDHGEEDWTNGCIAVRNEEILYIWENILVGTPILIRK